MANKQSFHKLMSGFPFVTPEQQSAYDAQVTAAWQNLNEAQRASCLAVDYRARIWYAGYLAGQVSAVAEEEYSNAWRRLCVDLHLPFASQVDEVKKMLSTPSA